MEHKKKEKASYSGLFDKGPMYNDKEVLSITLYIDTTILSVSCFQVHLVPLY